MAKALLIDTELCLECNACSVECRRSNDVPVGQRIAWTTIERHEAGTFPGVHAYVIKNACKHCTDAACEKACPIGAISKPDGVHVVVNQEICIKCGYCGMACPFGIPHYGEPEGPSQKCSFCYGKREEGEPTACAAACPFGAITFGEREELIQQGQTRIAQLQAKGNSNAYLYGVSEMGGTHALYVLADSPEVYSLPKDAQMPAMVTAWKDVAQPVGMALGAVAILGLSVNYIVARANTIKTGKKEG
ncbi:4Fe-4S dicluster domain-containing protein [Chloroflexota bacterium]